MYDGAAFGHFVMLSPIWQVFLKWVQAVYKCYSVYLYSLYKHLPCIQSRNTGYAMYPILKHVYIWNLLKDHGGGSCFKKQII